MANNNDFLELKEYHTYNHIFIDEGCLKKNNENCMHCDCLGHPVWVQQDKCLLI